MPKGANPAAEEDGLLHGRASGSRRGGWKRDKPEAAIYNIFSFTASSFQIVDRPTYGVTTRYWSLDNFLINVRSSLPPRSSAMGILYNTTSHATLNDVSVTTGNADGWIVLPRDPIGVPLAELSALQRPSKPPQKAKRRAPSKRRKR